MLDAVDARADARSDTGVAVRMRRDLDPGPMRFVDDGRELLVRVLLRARRGPLCDMTPPEAEILIRRAPYLIW